MRNNLCSKFFVSAIIFVSLTFSTLAFADRDTQALVAGYGAPMTQKYMWNAPYDQKLLTDSGTLQGQIYTQPFLSAITQQLTQLKQPTQPELLSQSLTTFNSYLAKINTLTSIPDKNSNSLPNAAQITNPNTGVAVISVASAPPPIPLDALSDTTRLNIESLLNPLVYSSDQVKEAQEYIGMISGLANPIRTIDFSRLLKVKDPGGVLYTPQSISKYLLNRPDVVNYLVSLRSYLAQVSVGLNNFYRMYEERIPIENSNTLGKQLAAAGTPASPSQLQQIAMPTSVLQVQQFLATRRIADTQWFAQMQQATPVDIQRQILFLLAEMQAQQFRTNMELERINATLSAMELQNAFNTKSVLEQHRDALEKTNPFSGQ